MTPSPRTKERLAQFQSDAFWRGYRRGVIQGYAVCALVAVVLYAAWGQL